MTTALTVLRILLQLGAFFAERAKQNETAEALKNEILILQGKRVRAARDAHGAVISGRMPVDPDTDPNRRD